MEAVAADETAAAAPPNTADDDLSSPQAIAKLHSDLVVARETVSSLRTALAKIDVENDPGAVHKPFVKNLAERCKQMRPRVVSLISDTRDEGLLMAALALNDELSDVAGTSWAFPESRTTVFPYKTDTFFYWYQTAETRSRRRRMRIRTCAPPSRRP